MCSKLLKAKNPSEFIKRVLIYLEIIQYTFTSLERYYENDDVIE
jgi:hypothetical protein